MKNCLIYTIENQPYAVNLDLVKYILQAVEVTEIPHSPKIILGAISIHGEIINVVNMRELLGLPHRGLGINDHFILCQLPSAKWILWVDRVNKIKPCTDADLILLSQSQAHTESYVIKNEEPMTLYFNLEKQLEQLCTPR